ncbi:hypothetical protein [Streptomyces sp. NPDC000931]|uniref:hypothetical protein n=1 Tax=Streptomyces sp. NPDC000931 TaxID=3154372 RepID=UPI003319157A
MVPRFSSYRSIASRTERGRGTSRNSPALSLSEDLVAQSPLPYQQTVSAMAAQRLPQAEGYRLNLLCLP